MELELARVAAEMLVALWDDLDLWNLAMMVLTLAGPPMVVAADPRRPDEE